ncbi:hypothetical protein BKA93DRAFT_465369 [Sparassis latifolia]|uniref:Uncharacterized protein n=1 Tax=Sparassis crispa TaxID=139825 RepID=A0A401H469_9APHY|nr:hypothetical protein SCP_1502440 [Sparassis crispa]GBE89236.1 hypothetical protein SCP_1502440 [Sparassis crispa]
MTSSETQSPRVDPVQARNWRHDIQKILLSKNPVKPEDVPRAAQLLTEMENCDGMKVEYLEMSKLPKVFRYILMLPPQSIPRESEFKILERIQNLHSCYQILLRGHTQCEEFDKQMSNLAEMTMNIGMHD